MKSLGNKQHILELFHGPTLAFKDFGARFMARLFSENAQKKDEEVTILVATSGDTGGAVANGFYKVPGVKVCLLYPKGKVSSLQEKQMTTLGENITALEVDGVFDDCQHLVKKAFLDKELNEKIQLSSANSINIARLLPQSFYYAFAVAELMRQEELSKSPVFSVPSGNFGNLTGGMLAGRMGLPIKHFLAATNVNDVVPTYLKSGDFEPKDSIQTISNAMDVGNPSNFSRMKFLFQGSENTMRKIISGYSYSDEETRHTILDVYKDKGYLLCPHTAIGYRAAMEYQSENNIDNHLITLATAHPVKFRDVIEPVIDEKIDLPTRLNRTLKHKKKSLSIDKRYESFKEQLIELNA
jgi:threonine synthase